MLNEANEFTYSSFDKEEIYAKSWMVREPKGIIQIVHGLGEMADYYEDFAEKMNESGYDVYLNEARGHGRTKVSANSANVFSDMVKDIFELTLLIKSTHKGLPVFLLGHSMGSILAQIYVKEYAEYIAGVILTGIPYINNVNALLETAEKEIAKNGADTPSVDTFVQLFADVNKQFEPVDSLLDWITSDKIKIQQYEKLPSTNVLYSNQFYKSFLLAVKNTQNPSFLNTVRKDLPVILLSGGKDAVSENGEYTVKKHNDLYLCGFKKLDYAIYEEMRHSILQEINRNLVEKDILRWINTIL